MRSVLTIGVQPPAVRGIDDGRHAVAVAHREPVIRRDSPEAGARRPAPVLMILQPGVEVVRIVHVDADRIDLADRQIGEMIARPACVVRDRDAAVAALNHPVGILGIDPQRAHVPEHPRKHARRVPRLAAIGRMPEAVLGHEDVLVVVRIDANLTEVVRALRTDIVVVGVHLGPRLTGIRRPVHLAPNDRNHTRRPRAATSPRARCHRHRTRIVVLDHGVDDVRIAPGDVETDPSDATTRDPAAELRPRAPGVRRLVNPAAGTAVYHLPRQPRLFIRRRVQHRRVLRVHHEIDDADLGADVEHLLPRGAAVHRPKHAAFLVLRVEVAHRGDVHDVGIRRMDRDARDVVRVLEAHVLPRLARVRRLVDAVARIRAARREGVARADPDDVRVRGRYGDVANRELALPVEHRLERRAVVGRLPHASGPERHVERVQVGLGGRGGHRDVRRSRAHPERTDVTVGKRLDQPLVEEAGRLPSSEHRERGCRRGREQDENEQRASHSILLAAGRGAGSFHSYGIS